MRVLTYYANLKSYRDRVMMLRRASESLEHIHLIVGGGEASEVDALQTERFTIDVAAPRMRGRALLQLAAFNAVSEAQSRFDFDLIHDTQGFLIPVLLAKRAPRLRRLRAPSPVLLTSSFSAAHEWYDDVRKQHPYRPLWFQRLRLQTLLEERIAVRLSDAATVFGEGYIEPFAAFHHIEPARVFSVPNCADNERFFPEPPRPAVHGFEADARVLLFVGNVFRYKGIFELLTAFAALRPDHPKLRLLVVGPMHDEERAPIAEVRRRLNLSDDLVRFVGRVERDDLRALYNTASVFVLPSYFEGSPRVVIEAMACGSSIVTTDGHGTRTLDPKGSFIRFVPRADADSLRDAVDAQLREPADVTRARMQAARERYLNGHTPDAAAAALVSLYRRLVPT